MYSLLPFYFTRISDFEVLINEVGDYVVVPKGTVDKIVSKNLNRDEDIYKTLHANFFISDQLLHPAFEILVERLAEKKHFLDLHTSLHIFVLTLRCNQNCEYCQASSMDIGSTHVSMSKDTMRRSVELMFKSKSPYLTMEFQGGEPSLEYDILKYGIEIAEEMNIKEHRVLNYVLCTNCFDLSDKIMNLCKKYNILISTSLDGPEFLHNKNRGRSDSHKRVCSGITKMRKVLGNDRVSALMTTSVESLYYPTEIVNEYVSKGFKSIFIRSLNPYGFANKNIDWDIYTDRFIEFYKNALNYIIELNTKGIYLREEFAFIILKKILTSTNTGFVDLQSPAGMVNSVLVYNYDGKVYCSDESRMLAEMNDFTFCLGSVHNKYEDLVYSKKVIQFAKVWANETLAGCSDCAFKLFCGADPVRNHSTQGDMYGYRPTSLFCKKNKSIIEFIFELLITRKEEVMPIFKRWFL